MDIRDIIITIAILAVGGLLGGKNTKKTGRKQASAQKPRPAFAQPDEEYVQNEWSDENFVEDWEEPVEEKGVFGSSYFSYEDQPAEPVSRRSAEPVKQEPVKQEPVRLFDERQESIATVLGETFDLRKAFIYQTIMERVEC